MMRNHRGNYLQIQTTMFFWYDDVLGYSSEISVYHMTTLRADAQTKI